VGLELGKNIEHFEGLALKITILVIFITVANIGK
jgi:hypothetical protein